VPDRYLREALLRSDLFNALSVEARELFTRLILVVDDFGCFDGRDTVIAGAVYPLDVHDVSEHLAELHRAGLIVRYSNRGKGYLAIMQWAELLRKTRRRFPAPPINIDKAKVKYRGAYNRPMDWSNPDGCDEVSLLLDHLGRAITPQPPEWRRPGDLLPIGCDAPQQEPVSLERQALERAKARAPTLEETPNPRAPTLDAQPLAPKHRAPAVAVTAVSTATPAAAAVAAAEVAPASSLGAQPSTTAATTNGIKFVNGEWQGLSEAQRLKWQGMFNVLSIPDQLDRAAAHLEANPEKVEAFGKGDSEHSFIVRWLLREVKAYEQRTGSTRAKTDA
jgi:hypothetical protein